MKKLLLPLLLVFAVLLTGCRGKNSNPALTPSETVNVYFQALNNYDMDTLVGLSVTDGSAAFQTDDISDGIVSIVCQNVTIQQEGNATISGDTATVKAKITTPDFGKLIQQLTTAPAQTASSSSSSSSSSGSESLDDIMADEMKAAMQQPNAPTITTEVDLHLQKVNNVWKLKTDDKFTDLVTGGLISFSKNLNTGAK